MVIRRSHCNCRQLGIDQKASSPQGNYLDQRKSLFGSSTDSELLGWLKRVALDPCTPEVLVRKLRNQTLTIRKVLSLSSAEFPQRKRKFQLFPGSGKFTTTLEFASERLNDQNAKQLAIVHSSSTSLVDSTECASAKKFLNSCSSYSILTSDDNFQKKVQLCFNFDNKNEGAHFNPSNNNISFQGNMDESIDASHSDSKSLVIEDASSISMDSNELVSDSNSSSSKETLWCKTTFLECKSRPVIPIGHGFLADIPEWRGAVDREDPYYDNPKTLKLLGTRIWPTNSGRTEADVFKEIRKKSCYCSFDLSQGS